MQILVLGNSDTRGDFAAGQTWPWVAASVVEAAIGEPVTVTERGFAATRPEAPAYAETVARELRPDVVVVPLGTFAFTVGFTWVRVQRLFGKRVARWYRKSEAAIDQHTRDAARQPNRLGAAARTIMRRTVGTQPMTSWSALAGNYVDVIRALARVEDVDVLLVAYPPERGSSVTNRRAADQRLRFLAAVGEEASRRHYTLVDSRSAYLDAPDPGKLYTPDGFHSSLAGHVVLGRLVGEAILQMEASDRPPGQAPSVNSKSPIQHPK